ncbi:hypothetical protein CEXT_618771 [Caerostris extrusa]|uniref:Uncharacterized protein n=1 Tax=Caerostris extrusa TaxID=172846 RepID=A0AAV4X7G5_CAEEX|nr:hypothetical protein CEXT_618771 [Caerostris extrusa]
MRPGQKSLFNSIGTLLPPLQIQEQRDTQRCLHSTTTFISKHPNKRMTQFKIRNQSVMLVVVGTTQKAQLPKCKCYQKTG